MRIAPRSLLWRTFALIALLIGLSLRGVVDRVGGMGVVLEGMAWSVAAIVAAVTLARFAWIFGSDAARADAALKHQVRLLLPPHPLRLGLAS